MKFPDLVKHELTKKELIGLLENLEDNDILIPNRVQNLLVVREGEGFGVINFAFKELEIWDDE